MTKTYRALGVVAIVILLVLIMQVIIIANTRIQGLPGPPPPFPFDSAAISTYSIFIWPLIATWFVPIICTFSMVVAGQTRQWAWFAVLLVTGLLGISGPVVPFYFSAPMGVAGASPETNFFIFHVLYGVIPLAIPTLAALMFAGLQLRANSPTDGERVGRA